MHAEIQAGPILPKLAHREADKGGEIVLLTGDDPVGIDPDPENVVAESSKKITGIRLAQNIFARVL